MNTRVLTDTAEAAGIIQQGGVVAIPTETVFGLAARIDDDDAIRRIFTAKGRPQDNPLIVHVADLDWLDRLCLRVPDYAKALARTWWPGPITLVLPASETVSRQVTAGLNTVGIRIPDHPDTLNILRALTVPVAAPSANRSGRPSPTTWEAVVSDLEGRIDGVFRSEATRVGLESTVVDCTGEAPVILRPGAVTLGDLQQTHPQARLHAERDSVERSPGTRHQHYRPDVMVRWADSDANKQVADSDPSGSEGIKRAYIGFNQPADQTGFARVLVVASLEAYAHHLFDFFRACEEEGMDEIQCEPVPRVGIGVALMDRITRAIG